MIKEVHGGNIYKYDHKVFDFSANLNPLGMPMEVKQAIIDNIDKYQSYPDTLNRELAKALGEFHNISWEKICCGNGAADIIFRIALGLKPKKALIISPTFSEYEEALEIVDCQANHYILKETNGFVVDEGLLKVIDSGYDMMFICNPNNPTGIPICREFMLSLAERCKENNTILVVDECFTEFLLEEEKYAIIDKIDSLKNVIILKAFTKIYAMAGVRLGYSVCGDVNIANTINQTLQPWSVSTIASKAGVAALKLQDFVRETKLYIDTNRKFLLNEMSRLGVKTYNSMANYIFFWSDIDLCKEFSKYNILLRSCSNYITLDENYYRIAVRTNEENQYFIDCLEKILNEKNGGLNG
ncbi:MAG: histidinol-phosphate transaminase [Anaerovoracaceae bacterium]